MKLRLPLSEMLHLLLLVLGGLSVPLYCVERVHYRHEAREFALALKAADAGRWYWDLKTNELFWDDQMFVLFGQIKEHWTPNYGGFEESLVPEDRDRVNAKVLQAIAEKGGYQDVFRIVTATGEVKEIRASAMVSPDGRFMTGINLPAIPRNGNFKASKSTRPSGAHGPDEFPVPSAFVDAASTLEFD